jgi:hypothetical protein
MSTTYAAKFGNILFCFTILFGVHLSAENEDDQPSSVPSAQPAIPVDHVSAAALQKSPFSGAVSLSSTVGSGTFLSGYEQNPQVAAYLYAELSYQLPKFWKAAPLVLTAYADFDYTYLPYFGASKQEAENQVRYNDPVVMLSMPNALEAKNIGIYFSPRIYTIAPISVTSRSLDRVVSLGAGTKLGWRYKGLDIFYLPTFTGHVYGTSGNISTCPGGVLPDVVNPHDPELQLETMSLPAASPRGSDMRGEGYCLAAGRKTIGSLRNRGTISYTYGAHSVELTLFWIASFQQPLAVHPELVAANANNNNFTESTLTRLAYTYTLPLPFELSLATGIQSSQAAYAEDGSMRFPFFDFVLGNNNTQVFLDITASI